MGKSGEGPNLSRSLSSSSSISSDFEFTISLSPTSRKTSSTLYCPADELFYKGQLLPLHLPPRLRIIQTLTTATGTPHPNSPPTLADRHASPPISFSSTTTTSRPPPSTNIFPPRLPPPMHLTSTTNNDSSDWSSDTTSSRDSNSSSCDSSRRTSSATTDDEDAPLTSLKKLRHFARLPIKKARPTPTTRPLPSLPLLTDKPPSRVKLSSIFLTKGKKMSRSAKNVFHKYISKMKPLYEKISHMKTGEERLVKARDSCSSTGSSSFHATHHSHSFSGNLNAFPKRKASGSPIRGHTGSCPPSMVSSPSHSGVLTFSGEFSPSMYSSSMEELQSAIQGAIAYCKSSNAVHDK